MLDLLWVTLAAGLAGFVDAIVGGGGLILLPTLFAVHPSALPATLFGTNKAAAIGGTAWACSQYARRVTMNWGTLAPAAVTALLASFAGAWLVTMVPATGLRKALPLVLLVVLLYTLWRKDLGRVHAPHLSPRREALRGSAIGAGIGFYDGFFGPGTGSFFVFLLVRGLGYDFLHASAGAKLLNTATNLAAIALFAVKGHVWWHVAAVMAVANVIGSLLGARLALRHGAGFVRGIFIAVVSLLILRTGWDALRL
ncbi:MAG: sulfite exporter TauE/SafE family protein [Sphaerotilus sulfidivorans]|uniref:sulfite exporter TauE/SafE family protein n=1 Tax=Sphaerotilus sulfidivorans TaxID=639200 RepID=UPI003F3FDB79